VTVADGGQSGIDAFMQAHTRGERMDAVITDLGMPHLDGRAVAAAVKAVDAQTTVILLTGWGARLAAESEVPVGVDRVLGKPPRLAELRAALAQVAGAGH
jgi:CheY-like chemotaxis protein